MPSLSHQLSPVQLSPVGSIVLPFGDSRNYRTDMERSFAEWMNRELLRRDWNQSDLVRRTGLSSSTLSRFATGKRIPSPKQADLIADVLGVDLDTVLAVAGHRPNPDPDDPPEVADLIALLRRIRMDRRKEAMIRANLLAILAWDDREAETAQESP